jgi:hypothetical protein
MEIIITKSRKFPLYPFRVFGISKCLKKVAEKSGYSTEAHFSSIVTGYYKCNMLIPVRPYRDFRYSRCGRSPYSESYENVYQLLGFEVPTAVVIKGPIFWDKTQCSLLKANRNFGGTCRLHLQSRRISQVRIQLEGGSKVCNMFLRNVS